MDVVVSHVPYILSLEFLTLEKVERCSLLSIDLKGVHSCFCLDVDLSSAQARQHAVRPMTKLSLVFCLA